MAIPVLLNSMKVSPLLQPRSGRIPLVLAFGYALAVSVASYWMERNAVVIFPVIVSGLPFAATNQRQGVALRVTAVLLLALWVILGAASIGLFYSPAVIAMIVAAAKGDTTPPGESDAS